MPGLITRWGEKVLISTDPAAPPGTRPSATVVDTALLKEPVVWLIGARFSAPVSGFQAPGGPWGTTTPVAMRATLRRGIDPMGGIQTDTFDMVGGAQFPVSITLAHRLEILLTVTGVPASTWAEIIAVPIDCADPTVVNVAPGGPLGGWATSVVTRVAAAAADTLLLPANPGRRQFVIANNSAQDLAVLFGTTAASLAAGAENFSFLLPGGAFATYESPIGGYTGQVRGIWRAADAAGEALLTAGFF